MERIEIIGIVIASVAPILGGLWYIVRLIIKLVRTLDDHTHRFDLMDRRCDSTDRIFSERFESMDQRFSARFDSMDERFSARFDSIDEKFAHIDERFSHIDEKFGHIDEKFAQMDKKIDCMGVDIKELGSTVGHLETRVACLDDSVAHLGIRFDDMGKRFDRMESKVDRIDVDVRRLDVTVNRMSSRFEHYESSASRFGSSLRELELSHARMGVEVSRMDSNFTRLPCALHSEELIKLRTVLVTESPDPSLALGLRASPRRLSEIGLKIYADIGGAEFLHANKDALFRYISFRRPLAALDVEELCPLACMSLIPTPAFTVLKDYIYNASPISTPAGTLHELTLRDLCFTLSLPLRDMYLSEIGLSPVPSS